MILKSDLVSSRQNEAVKRLLSLDDKKGRDTEGVFVLDGIKLFEEAVKSGAKIDTVYISSEKEEQYLPFITSALQGELYATTRVIRLETSLFERISREKSPQGVITLVKYLDKIQNIIKINKVTTFLNDGVSAQGILLLNGIQDPGNLGAVIRSAVAFGKNKIILDTDCVDIYHPRVLRATMGGIFRLRVMYTEHLAACVEDLRTAGRRVFAAELRDGSVSLQEAGVQPTDCIVIGNEGHGISPAVSRACNGSVYLPIAPGTESLNAAVAASIFLWETREV